MMSTEKDDKSVAADVRPGDVVLARLPNSRTGEIKTRPALVLEAERRDDINGGRRTSGLRLADSDARWMDKVFPGQMRVEGAGAREAGLREDRKFDLARQHEVSYDRDHLMMGRSGDPRIGRLNEVDMVRARVALQRAQKRFGNLPEVAGMRPPAPRPGDVVYLYSPFHDAPDTPAPKPRPCIVMGVRRVTDENGQTQIMVRHAPGTSRNLFRQRPGDVNIEDPDRIAAVGDGGPGKFKLGEEKVVPWSQAYICHRAPGPRIGRIGDPEIQQLRAARRELTGLEDAARSSKATTDRPKKERAEAR